jgi:hypothetical protein
VHANGATTDDDVRRAIDCGADRLSTSDLEMDFPAVTVTPVTDPPDWSAALGLTADRVIGVWTESQRALVELVSPDDVRAVVPDLEGSGEWFGSTSWLACGAGSRRVAHDRAPSTERCGAGGVKPVAGPSWDRPVRRRGRRGPGRCPASSEEPGPSPVNDPRTSNKSAT